MKHIELVRSRFQNIAQGLLASEEIVAIRYIEDEQTAGVIARSLQMHIKDREAMAQTDLARMNEWARVMPGTDTTSGHKALMKLNRKTTELQETCKAADIRLAATSPLAL